jgi:quercetin dioxygenase-like cupin family protein
MRRTGALVALITAANWLMFPASAAATPGSGVNAWVMTQSSVDGTDYIMREIIIEPGGSTGWHWHDGHLYGVVKMGTLTHDTAQCRLDGIYNPGDPIREESGPEHVHIGRNLGTVPVVLQVLYIKPAGTPLSQDAPDPGCGFA